MMFFVFIKKCNTDLMITSDSLVFALASSSHALFIGGYREGTLKTLSTMYALTDEEIPLKLAGLV